MTGPGPATTEAVSLDERVGRLEAQMAEAITMLRAHLLRCANARQDDLDRLQDLREGTSP